MKIHKEGYKIILISSIIWIATNALCYSFELNNIIFWSWLILSSGTYAWVISFFRSPQRKLTIQDNTILCPADGKLVVNELVENTEYHNQKFRQLSVFMSPFNVHVNRYPIAGKIEYVKYHAGSYLVAWHPKSSTENERTTVAMKTKDGQPILYRQIAGAMARRIVNYAKEGLNVSQGEECGFIKFGSRVDILIPPDMEVKVKLGQTVKGGVDVLAQW